MTSADTRETTVNVKGTTAVVRTWREGRTDKQLETAHLKAVRTALEALRDAAAPEYTARVRTMKGVALEYEIRRVYGHESAKIRLRQARNKPWCHDETLQNQLITTWAKRRFTAVNPQNPSPAPWRPKLHHKDGMPEYLRAYVVTEPALF